MKEQVFRISELNLEEKIGQMFMIGFKEEFLTPEVQSFINESNIGFIDIFARNISSIKQATSLINQIHQQAKIPPMIFTDQEGGVVCQFAELTSTFSSNMGMAATGNPSFIELGAEILAEEMNLIGIDGLIAPTLDINHEPDNPIIGLRSYSDDVQTVIQSGKSFIKGARQSGLATMPKHFPGHGGSQLDSHLILPTLDFSEEFFELCDLMPFREVAKEVDFIMTAHIAVPNIEASGLPATFSKKFLTHILRNQFEFKGIVVSDCIEMDVIKNNYTPEEIVDYSINAGIDVFLISHSIVLQKELYRILVDKVKSGHIDISRIDASVQRILSAKEKYGLNIKRKQRDIKIAVSMMRNKREIEDYICKHTIVLLRDKLNKLPIKRGNSLGIIEWDKARSTVQLNEPVQTSYLAEQAKKYFDRVEVMVLPLKKTELTIINDFLQSFDNIILAPFSRTPEVEMIQANMIREIVNAREDVIIVATGNPYDIRNFPDAKIYLATFGYRDSQIQALFDNLTGVFQPSGKLPVDIKGIFPRWYSHNSNHLEKVPVLK